MKLIHVAAAVVNQTPLDWDGNKANIVKAIRDARSRGVRILCLPELCISGYGCEDAFFSASLRRTAREIVQSILPETHGMAVSLGLPLMHEGSLFNTCVLAVDGKIEGLVAKQHLAGDGLHYEPRWFKPWPAGVVTSVDFNEEKIPIGDLLFDLDGIRVGFEICEDAWVAHRPGSALADRCVDVILNPSASHFAFEKYATRRQLVAEGSRAFNAAYVYSNLVGNEAGRAIYDGGALIATAGEIVASGSRFTYCQHEICDATVDVDANRMKRSQVATRSPDLKETHGLCRVAFEWNHCEKHLATSVSPEWSQSDHLLEEEFSRAISLALFDYARKSRTRGFVVSLSGGADSSAVACLVRLMIDFCEDEIGLEGFCERFGMEKAADADPASLANSIVTTVYQATRNSSEATSQAARTVAKAIGASHYELNVEDLRNRYVGLIEEAVGRKLQWDQDDIALQNIQARVRAPGAWLIANIRNALLLATSNRSEAAVGYATMDGDTCGGISPIAGIDKAFLRRWLVWLEETGPAGRGPIPELHCVNRLQPSAELRPPDQNQTDEDDLMPYDVLDAIEDEAIGLKRSPEETLTSMVSRFPEHSRADLLCWVERFYTLWCRNQWKRERYAPSFHVDDKNLDPKTWCRFPILSGGFRWELNRLRKNEQS